MTTTLASAARALITGSGLFVTANLLGCADPRPNAEGRTGSAGLPTPTVFQTDSVGAEIWDIALADEIWAANRGPLSVARYSRDGRQLWHGVTIGEGPDQTRITWSVAAAGDTGFAWDPVTRRVLRIVNGRVTPEATLAYTSTRTVSGWPHAVVHGNPGRLRRWTGGWVTYATDSAQWNSLSLTRMVVLRFTPEGTIVDTLADLRPQGLQALMEQRSSTARNLIAVPLWDICMEQRFVLFDPRSQVLVWRDLRSEDRDSLQVDFTPGEIPEAFARGHMFWELQIASMGKIPDARLRADVEEGFPSERYIYGTQTFYATSLFCDATGLVWMQRFSVDAPPKGFSSRWEVHDLATKTHISVVLPDGFQAKAADSSLVYGVVEDEDGVQSVATLPRAAVLSELPR